MNEESLSALLDGECSPSELDRVLRQLDQDPALRERFSRLSLAQDIRRGGRVQPVRAGFADRVMAALPERPGLASPAPVSARPPAQSRRRPLVALAAAAAVGGIALLAVLQPGPTVDPVAAPPAPVAAAPALEDDQRIAELDDENARQLRNYVMAYSQSRAQQGMGGTLGYARYAAYTDDRASDGSR